MGLTLRGQDHSSQGRTRRSFEAAHWWGEGLQAGRGLERTSKQTLKSRGGALWSMVGSAFHSKGEREPQGILNWRVTTKSLFRKRKERRDWEGPR